jgi:hypothetical protein
LQPPTPRAKPLFAAAAAAADPGFFYTTLLPPPELKSRCETNPLSLFVKTGDFNEPWKIDVDAAKKQ